MPKLKIYREFIEKMQKDNYIRKNNSSILLNITIFTKHIGKTEVFYKMPKLKIYREFIEKMQKDNYIRKNNSSILLSDTIFTKHIVKKDTIGKFLELTCPDNAVITVCGRKMNCDKEYEFKIKCYDDDLKEPFINPFKSSFLVSKKTKEFPGIIINYQIIITKISNKKAEIEPGWEKWTSNTLKIINSKNPNEYPLWTGGYGAIGHFYDYGIYIESGQKLVFYAINSDIDIKNIDLKMEVDMFEKK